MSEEQIFITASIILVAGLVGGTTGYYVNRYENKDENSPWILFVLISLIGSGVVPLFLQMISSDLIRSTNTDASKFFVLMGFCLVASVYSKRFVGSIAEKLIRDVEQLQNKTSKISEETAENSKEVQALIDAETKDDNILNQSSNEDNSGTNRSGDSLLQRLDLTEKEIKVLRTLNDRNYKFRTLNGIKDDMTKDGHDNQIIFELNKLIQKQLINRLHRNTDGEGLYGLSRRGNSVLENLDLQQNEK